MVQKGKKNGCALSSSGGTNERTNDLGGMTRLCCGSNTLDDKDADTEKNKKYDQVFGLHSAFPLRLGGKGCWLLRHWFVVRSRISVQ